MIVLRSIGIIGAVCALAGCGMPNLGSTLSGGVFDSKKPQNTWKPEVTEATMLQAAQTGASTPDMGAANLECPPFTAASAADKILTVYETGRQNDNQYVMHRGEITKTARECQILANSVILKFGVAGRVILGPKGKGGVATLPAVIQVVDQAKAKVKSIPIKLQAQTTLDDPVGYFSLVQQIEFPIAPGIAPKDYRVFISFEKKAPGTG